MLTDNKLRNDVCNPFLRPNRSLTVYISDNVNNPDVYKNKTKNKHRSIHANET